MSRPSLIERAVVLGVNGFVGRVLARRLIESGVSVAGLDLHAEASDSDLGMSYGQCDATAPGAEGVHAIGAADAVLVCLPEDAAIKSLPVILQAAAGDSLIVDTLSVKERVVAAVRSLRPTQEYLSVNLMFSPKIGFAGQNVAVVQVNGGPRGADFVSLLASWGAKTVHVQADEHDRITALVQVATHAALISIGLVLHDWGYDLQKGIAMATPPHRICLALLTRMCDASPEVYWDIQQSNSFGADARRVLADKLRRLSEIVAAGREDEFRGVMANIAGVLEPMKHKLLDCADSISAASSL
jgi:prephenate dehydrogenase